MQKIFRRWIILIMSTATLLALVINIWMKGETLEQERYKDFTNKLNQVVNIMENNNTELKNIEDNLDTDYMIRCRAVAFYFYKENPEENILDVSRLQTLAKVFDVDEVHLINEDGIIEASSVEQYVNFDLYSGEQGASFMELAQNRKEGESFVQETMANSAEGVIMKYVGVLCEDGKIVQVGFKPIRELEAKGRNTYEYIFEKFPISKDGEYFAIDRETGMILGHSNTHLSGTADEYHSYERMLQCTEGKFLKMENGEIKYVVTMEYGDVLLGLTGSGQEIFHSILMSTVKTAVLLICLMVIVILALNQLLKRVVVNGVHEILDGVSDITGGKLDTVVRVGGNPEFEELSRGINIMVEGLQYENNHDHLTGLCNYKFFKNIAGVRLAQMKEDELFAVVMLDLDSFKQINDTYGHDIGDRYLREFSAILSRMPQEHCYVARRSGDEFSMCIFGCREKTEIDSLIGRLEELVSCGRVKVSDTEEIAIRISGGYVVAGHSSKSMDLEELMKKADEALYRQKRGEKGSIEEY